MVNQELINWIKENREKGFSFLELKKFYLESGGSEKLYDEAINSIQKTKKSKGVGKKIVLSIFFVLILVSLVGGGVFYFKNKKRIDRSIGVMVNKDKDASYGEALLSDAKIELRDARRQSVLKSLEVAIVLYMTDNGKVPNPTNPINPWSAENNSLESILSKYLPGGLQDDPLKEAPRDWIYCFNPTSNKHLIATSMEQNIEIKGELDNVVNWEARECISSDSSINKKPICSDFGKGIVDDDVNVTVMCMGSDDVN
jgi:hypothetical protein